MDEGKVLEVASMHDRGMDAYYIPIIISGYERRHFRGKERSAMFIEICKQEAEGARRRILERINA